MPILPTGNPLRAAGFTLLELLVVLAIIALGAALVMPQLGERDVALLKSETRRAVTLLNYARRSALIQGKTTQAVFYPLPAEDAPGGKPADNQAELTWISRGPKLEWKAGKQEDSALPVDAPKEQDKEAEPRIVFTFYPEGGGSGGELILKQAEYQTRISVHSLTGKVEAKIGDEK